MSNSRRATGDLLPLVVIAVASSWDLTAKAIITTSRAGKPRRPEFAVWKALPGPPNNAIWRHLDDASTYGRGRLQPSLGLAKLASNASRARSCFGVPVLHPVPPRISHFARSPAGTHMVE